MLRISNLTLHIDQHSIENINLSVDGKARRRVAVIGRNGVGKSTFLKQIVDEEATQHIHIEDETIVYMHQEIEFGDYEFVGEFLERLLDESWNEYKIDIALDQVGLQPEDIYLSLETLSGGQKVKVYLASLLLQDPSILIMDEPTNNLDILGVQWLENFVKEFKGSVILVSHDRYFLNNVINTIWEINEDEHTIIGYQGNYENFLEERKKRYEMMLDQYKREERKAQELDIWLRAHQFHPKYRFSAIVGSKKKVAEQLEKNRINKPVDNKSVKIHDLNTGKRGRILKVDIKEKSFGPKLILEDLSFTVHAGERLLISGPNGAGKTTLMKIIVGEDEDFDGEILWSEGVTFGFLKQFSGLDGRKTILEAFQSGIKGVQNNPRGILARYLFDTDTLNKKVKVLSFGEKKRLDLAIILANKPNVLILDEPTNHLDIFTRETIESFLVEQKIPMIIISHDRYFVEKMEISDVVSLKNTNASDI